jgi:DNA repair exonuclease SbcCD nuclease subunit
VRQVRASPASQDSIGSHDVVASLAAVAGARVTLILNSSDWHADALSAGVDRFDDVAQAVAQTVKVAREEKVDLYLFTGDLCDPDDAPRVLRAVGLMIETAMELAGAGIDAWLVPGNHDVVENGSGRSTLSPLAALGIDEVSVFDRPEVALLPGRPKAKGGAPAHAVLLPYPPASRPYDPARFVREARARTGVAMVAGHMTELTGVPDGEETREMMRGRGVPFPLVECDPRWLLVNGHWHEGQTFRSGEREVVIPGSLARLTHGEAASKPRFLLLEV